MKPESHLVVGLAIGAALSHLEPNLSFGMLTAASVVGACVSDIPTAIKLFSSRFEAGRRFNSKIGTDLWFASREVSHSPLLWLMILLSPHLGGVVLAFSVGLFTHWAMDVYSHSNEEYHDTDQSFLFPFYIFWGKLPLLTEDIPKLGRIVSRTGISWEYRPSLEENNRCGGLTQTKVIERLFQIAAIILWISLLVTLPPNAFA